MRPCRRISHLVSFLALALTVGVLGGCGWQAAVSAPAPHAVSWTLHLDPGNDLPTLDDIRAAMDAPWGDSLLVTPAGGDARDAIELASCSDYLAVRDHGVAPASPDLAIFQARAVACVAAERVLAGRPFAFDHLGDPVFDAALPDRLPVGVASITSASEYEDALADPALRTWSDYAGPLAFEARDATSGTYREEGGGQTMTIALVARGDFNGDGIGDALLQSHEAAEGGSWRASRLFLVTQRTKDGAVELLETFDAWQGSRP